MSEIKKIYSIPTDSGMKYVGTIRNAKKFDINDKVFFESNGEISYGRVVGIELGVGDNPYYSYKIEITEQLATKLKFDDIGVSLKREIVSNVKCERMFSSIEEAKQSAIDHVKKLFEVNMKDVERYFGQFEEAKQ